MYSQYNQYQQYQQQQQPSVQTGMVWNGTSWVSSNPVRSTSITTSSSGIIPSNPVQTFTQYYHGWMERHKILAERMQRINLTTTTKEQEQEEQRQQLELEQQWAKYYADESSRAAHYFYQNPNHHGTTISSLPFALPPAPPSPTAENQNPKQQQLPKQQLLLQQQQKNNHSSSYSLVVHSQRSSSSSSSSCFHANSNPKNNNNKSQNNTNNISNNNNNKDGSLTRYLKRNLELCQTEDERKYVQTQIESKIATAIQQGTLQSRDWDQEPMIIIQIQNNNNNNNNNNTAPVPSRALPTQKPTNYYGNYESNNSSNFNSKNMDPKSNYYGPASVTATPTNNNNSVDANYHYQYGNNTSSHNNNNNKRKSSSNNNNNYYGSASSNNSSAENCNNYNNPTSSCSFSSPPPAAAAASSSFPVSFALSQNTNTNQYTNGKRHKKRQWDTSNSSCTTTNSVGGQDDDDQQEDFLALPGGGTTTSSQKSRRPTYKKLRTNKLVVSKEMMMIDDGMDISHEALVKRANRFSSHHHHHHHHNPKTKSLSLVAAASSSNHDRYMGKGLIGGSNTQLDETDYEQMTVKGTSTILEKEYLRLTAPPRPERVRPLPILKRHLNNIKMEYYYCLLLEENEDDENEDGNHGENNEMKEEMIQKVLYERERTPQTQWNIRGEKQISDSGQQTTTTTTTSSSSSSGRRIARRRHDYLWFCSQLKAVRQDCTVQRIQGTFAVDVYETHARIALQEGDLNEYNQCQTQLKELYKSAPCSATDPNTSKDNVTLQQEDQDIVAEKDSSSTEAVSSSSSSSSSSWQNEDEFIAYRLLYYVYLSTNEKYSGGSSDMFQIMLSLSPTQKKHPAISHALQVREAVACSDYYCFFRLLSRSSSQCPNLGIFLIDLLVPTMRMRGLRRIAKAYRPSIEVTVCLEQLGFVQEQRIVNDDGNSGNGDDGNSGNDGNDDSEDKVKNDFQHGKEWMVSCGAVLTDEGLFLTKDSEIHEPVAAKKNSLI